VEHRIRADEEAEIWIDPHEESGVKPVRILQRGCRRPSFFPYLT
jgi:hypothetical protein